VRLTAYENVDLFSELKSEWNELLHRSMANRVFSTWEWQSTWWEAYHPGQLWVIVCRDETGRMLGIAPWFIEDNPKRGRVIRSIGCVDVTDYLDVIVDKDCTTPILDCFASYLAAHSNRFDLLDLCNIPEHSPTYEHFPKILQNHGFSVEVKQQEVCPIIQLPGDWESYLSMLDKRDRHELRRKLRIADAAPEGVDWYIVNDSHDLNTELDKFLSLMAASDPQKAEFLRDSKNVAFFRAIVPIAYQNGWLQLCFLTVGGQPSATYFNFDYERHILVYNSGLDPARFGHLSPGIVLLAYNIRYAIENGYEIFDFLRGNEAYKYRLGGRDVAVYMLMAQKDT
jgi:CelD/BcsL family acetyltransferase involved in cellulose biosynthesis